MTSISVQVPRRLQRAPLRAIGFPLAILATAGLAGCVTVPYVAKAPNPDNLTPEALNLRVMLIAGCMPIVLGQKTDTEVMPKLGYAKHRTFSWPMPSSEPHWIDGNWKGLGAINTGRRSCYFTVFGSDVAQYEQVVTKVLHDKVGVEPADIRFSDRFKVPQPGFTTSIPASYSGCVNGVGFGYDEVHTKRGVQFDVSLSGNGCSMNSRAATR